MQQDPRFNVRVYGLLIHNGAVLLSDEVLGNKAVTKFPGGGLEWGEGIKDCLVREFREELELTVTVGEIVYLTDFFQQSNYRKSDQIIAVYYSVSCLKPEAIPVKIKPYDFDVHRHGAQAFRWVNINALSEDLFYFPIDKIVVALLKTKNT